MKTTTNTIPEKNNAESAIGEPRITYPTPAQTYVVLSDELQPVALNPDQCATHRQPKFCKDCAYFTEPFKSRPRCAHPLVPKEDLIYGDNRRCEDARKNFLANNCGWEAVFFTAKTDIPSNTPS